MTIATSTGRVQYNGNGATVLFTVPFYFLDNTHLQVVVTSSAGVDSTKVLTTDYTVSGAGNPAGGSITMLTPPAAGETLTIIRNIAITQTTDLVDNDPLPAEVLETSLDKAAMIDQQLAEKMDRALIMSAGTTVSGQLPDAATRANKLLSFDASGNPTVVVPPTGTAAALQVDLASTAAGKGAALIGFIQSGTGAQPRTVESELRDAVSVFQFMTPAQIAAVQAGTSTNDSTMLQNAINTGKSLKFPPGTYKAANLTQSTNFQRFYADGDAKIVKCANGPIITSTGADVEFNGISFRGDAATPTFTGDNVVSSGNNFRMVNCGSRWASGRAVRATGNHCQIIGTCDLYQTADATASGFDIELGVSGTATLYHHISQVYSSQATGGIRTVDTGSVSVVGSQFGKLTVANGTGPGGVNGGMFVGNRILGDVSVNVSGSTFAANQFGGSSITFAAGTSGHQLNDNPVSVSTTLTDNSTGSVIVDPRIAVQTNYTPVWTAAVTNPVLGNGTLQGVYTRTGKRVDVQIYLAIGSTTTLGSGVWYLTLPFAASTTNAWVGAAHGFVSGTANYSLTASTLLDGTSRIVLNANGAGSSVNSATPASWVSGSYIAISLTYYTPA
jgi:hypothetical protein